MSFTTSDNEASYPFAASEGMSISNLKRYQNSTGERTLSLMHLYVTSLSETQQSQMQKESAWEPLKWRIKQEPSRSEEEDIHRYAPYPYRFQP